MVTGIWLRGCVVIAIASAAVPARADRGHQAAVTASNAVSVLSPVSGMVMRLYARRGSHVEKGDLLATIAAPDVSNSTSDVIKALAALKAAEVDLERQRELHRLGEPQKDLEAAEDAYLAAKAELERARRNAAQRHGIGEAFELRAPLAGEILRQNATPGMDVVGQYASSEATELFVIGYREPAWVLVEAPPDEGSICVGTRRAILHAGAPPVDEWLERAALFALSLAGLAGLAVCSRRTPAPIAVHYAAR